MEFYSFSSAVGQVLWKGFKTHLAVLGNKLEVLPLFGLDRRIGDLFKKLMMNLFLKTVFLV